MPTPRPCRRGGCCTSWRDGRRPGGGAATQRGRVDSRASSIWWPRRDRSRCSRGAGARASRCIAAPPKWRWRAACRQRRRAVRAPRVARGDLSSRPGPGDARASHGRARRQQGRGRQPDARVWRRRARPVGPARRGAGHRRRLPNGARPTRPTCGPCSCPVTRASLALHDGKPAEAVLALEPARNIETGGLGALVPLYLRAEAYRQQGDWAAAAAEYERLIQHRGTDPYAPMVPLAWLGLGACGRRRVTSTVSRTSYEMALSHVARRRQRLSAATRRAGRVRSPRAGSHRP